MQPRLLCFDLDGTLTDPAPGITACLQHAATALGRQPPAAADLHKFIGPPLREGLAQLLATDDASLVEQALSVYRARFSSTGLFENSVYTGVPPVLAELQGAGYALRVVTSKAHVYADRIIDHFGLRQYFPRVYGAELSGERSTKAELLALVLEQEQLETGRVCMIGDRSHDIVGAKAHGILAVGVTWGYGSRQELESAGADLVIDAVAELPAKLASR